MAEETEEAKDFDTLADEHLEEAGKESPEVPSTEKNPEEAKTEEPESSGAEPVKTEEIKAVEDDSTLSSEDKIGKIKDILGDDEEALDAYIKDKGYHNEPAWIKQREIIDGLKKKAEDGALSEEDKAALSEFKEYRSSPEYVRTSMKSQGFTQEAIDKKLQEMGHDVETAPEDDVQLVIDKLGINIDGMTPQDKESVKANIEDIVKVADILITDRLGKTLPKELAPIKEHIGSNEQKSNADKVLSTMQEIVKTDGVLDFEKDIEPLLDKYMDENPDAFQSDIFEHFKQINHSLTIDRLKLGKNKDERDELKSKLRQNVPISKSPEGLPDKTGNFEKDAEAFLDKINV